ncbi:hypothetical protein ANTPLA_LOCUS2886 [Anthophora plagiata]
MQKNRKPTIPSVQTKNRFSVLQNTMDVDPEVNLQQAHAMPSESKIITKKLLPLVIHGTVNDHQKFVTLIKNVVKNKFHIKYNGDPVSVSLQSTTDFDNLKRTWKEKSLSFHTYTKKEEKKRVYVIKGLHGETTIEEIKIELQKQDIKTDNITKIKEPACSKCAGKHHTREYTKPRTDPAKCVNCNSNHPANATICIAYINRITWLERNKPPEITQQQKIKSNSNNSHIIDITNKEQFSELGNPQRGRPATVTTHLQNVWTQKGATGNKQNNHSHPEDTETITELLQLTSEIKRLNEIINITKLLSDVKQLNNKLTNCETGIEKFELFVQFCQQLD